MISALAHSALNPICKPDGTMAALAAGAKSFSDTDTPGIYSMTGVEPPFRFAVNLAPEESKTAPLPMEQLEKLGVPLRVQPSRKGKRREKKLGIENRVRRDERE